MLILLGELLVYLISVKKRTKFQAGFIVKKLFTLTFVFLDVTF
jgi:hypothetical protein